MNLLNFIFVKCNKIWYQIFIIAFSFILILTSFYHVISRFNSLDPKMAITHYKPQKKSTSIKHPELVETGIHIKNFTDFDFIQNIFEIDAIVWFKFDPNTISLKTIESFSFDMGIIKEKGDPIIRIINKILFVQYPVRVKFKARLNFSMFPLDDHQISLVLKNEKISHNEIRFISKHNYFTTTPFLYTSDWIKVKHHVENGGLSSMLDSSDKNKSSLYPCTVFSIDFTQSGIRKLLVLFMPLFLTFLLGLFSLILKLKGTETSINRLAISGLSGLIILRFVIESLSPKVGYFTIIDTVYTVSLGCVFIVFMVEILFIHYIQNMKTKKLSIEETNLKLTRINEFRQWLFSLLILSISLSIYYSIYFN